ncbi:MAG TPA: YihY/virulence factor BrkB family protein [Streptosporangiaceae bacterium]|nr:YihY/virulence factor BrkB family protein [Streptosporangiaceae bacterium]
MTRLQALQRAADCLQQRHAWLAFPLAAWKKFSDDRAGLLAALIAYYAFIALFPLFLALVTILDLVLAHDPALRERVVSSALSNYPVFAPELKSNVHALGSTGLALAIGLIGTLFGARGLAAATQNALNTTWAIPRDQRPDWPHSLLRSIGLIVLVGPGEVATSLLAGLAAGGGDILPGAGARTVAVAASLVLDSLLFWLAFRLATASGVRTRDLCLSAVIAAVSWQVLQVVGGYLIAHQLARNSALYGVFALVLGLLVWLFLQAQISMYAVEVNVVLVHRLWPRSVIRSRFVPSGRLTDADLRAYRMYARAERRMPDLAVRLETPEMPAEQDP